MLSRAFIYALAVPAIMVSGEEYSDELTLLQSKLDDDIGEHLVSLLQVKTEMKSDQEVETEYVSYADHQKKIFQDSSIHEQLAALPPVYNGTERFVSNNGLSCVDGPARTLEGGLALLKAGLHGALYNKAYGGLTGSCAALGYTVSGGELNSYPGLQTYAMNQSGLSAFRAEEQQALSDYRQRYSLRSDEYTQMLHTCTSHPLSYNMKHHTGTDCASATFHQVGAWVHHDLNGNGIMCDEGPFQDATFALATIKSTAQLRMHINDSIAATGCNSLGFPLVYPEADHCFANMHMWTKTNIFTDAGIKTSQRVESLIFPVGGVFDQWAATHKLNIGILHSIPGCHCSLHSIESPAHCMGLNAHPPIRDWWTS